MSAAIANKVGPQVLRALGLPVERCVGFSITFEVGDAVTVEARYYAEHGAFDEIEQVFRALRPSE